MTAKISRPSLALAVVLLASACSGLSGGGGSKTQSGGAVTGTVLLPKAPTPAIAFYSDSCPMSGHTPALESLSGVVARSEERRLGQECVSHGRSPWAPYQ